MEDPFRHARQFPYSVESEYYAGVITLPAKKLFKNIEYQNMDQKTQKNILLDIMSKLDYRKAIKYYSFEYHPSRNNKKPCLHMNLLFEFNHKLDENDEKIYYNDIYYPDLSRKWVFFKNLKALTKSTIIDKICYIGEIKTIYDVYNWINYMHKDYVDHLTQYTDYQEDMLDTYNLEKWKEAHKPLFNELDHK